MGCRVEGALDSLAGALLGQVRPALGRLADGTPAGAICVDPGRRFALALSTHDGDIGELCEEERASLGPVPLARQMEFAAGRRCARSAFEALGRHLPALPRGSSGVPLWPPGTHGSISHADGVACALLGTGNEPVGVDIERMDRRVESRAWGNILRADEVASGEAERFIVFSVKEAFFKMSFAQVGRLFWFDAVRISWERISGHCRVTLARELTPNLRRGTAFRACYALFGDYVMAWIFAADTLVGREPRAAGAEP